MQYTSEATSRHIPMPASFCPRSMTFFPDRSESGVGALVTRSIFSFIFSTLSDEWSESPPDVQRSPALGDGATGAPPASVASAEEAAAGVRAEGVARSPQISGSAPSSADDVLDLLWISASVEDCEHDGSVCLDQEIDNIIRLLEDRASYSPMFLRKCLWIPSDPFDGLFVLL